ncbi:MAG: GNAT family N-acetyltransferase [Vulcanimicrobiaceae bacterium]
MSRLRLEPLRAALVRPALEYLARRPYENVFLAYMVRFSDEGLGQATLLVVRDGPDICGVAYLGRQIVIAAENKEAIDALARRPCTAQDVRMIVGPRQPILDYWAQVQGTFAQPRLVRDRQYVMALERARLRPSASEIEIRTAHPTEWRIVAENSAQMIAYELDSDARAAENFDGNIRLMIDRRLWWVGVVDAKLCFFCNIGPWSEQTAQLQGIWSPPELRGQGYATQALSGICAALFKHVPTLSLYVNDFNVAAIALYERVGFQRVGEFTTILF